MENILNDDYERHEQKLERFKTWLLMNGSELSNVELRTETTIDAKVFKNFTGDGMEKKKQFERRVFVSSPSRNEDGNEKVQAIKKNERIVFVPFSLLIGTEGLRVGTGSDSAAPFPFATTSERLAAEVLRQRDLGNESKFFEYIECLPEYIDTPTAGEWTSNEIKEMQFADAIGVCAKTLARDQGNTQTYFNNKAEQSSTTIEEGKTSYSHGNWTKKDWQWAMSIARSRAVEIDAEIAYAGENRGKMPPSGAFVAPFIDMCNHTHVDPSAFWKPAYSEKKQKEMNMNMNSENDDDKSKEENKPDGIELVARRDLEHGDEVTVSYAVADSDTFLLFGGFVTETRNPRDTVELWRTLPEAATWLSEKLIDAGSSEQNKMAIPLEYSKGVAYAIVEQRRQHILEAMGQNKAEVNKFDWASSGLDESVRAGWNFARDEAHHSMFSFIAQNVMQGDNDNDELYRQVLIGRISELLTNLPTSMEDDVAIMEQCSQILENNNNNEAAVDQEEIIREKTKALRLKTCCRYRGQKKAILHQWLQFLTKGEMPRDLTSIKNKVKAKAESDSVANELASMM